LTQDPKLNQYLRAETFQTINDSIKRSIKSSKKVKSPRKDTERLIEDNFNGNKKEDISGFLALWDMFSKIGKFSYF